MTLRTGIQKPDFDIYYGYHIFPLKDEYETNNIKVSSGTITMDGTDPKLIFDNMNKYPGAKKVVITTDSNITNPTNYRITNVSLPVYYSGEKSILIDVEPKVSSTGIGKRTYVITVKSSGNTQPDPKPTNPDPNIKENPQTGNNVAIIMSLVLVLSFSLTIYLYKRNVEKLDN
jgi:uncharacterized protein (UPF0371 family)